MIKTLPALVLIVDAFVEALNSGDVDTAVTIFAENSLVEDLAHHETYLGPAEIRPMLQAMWHEGRQYEIIHLEMTGDTITMNLEISDHGTVWAAAHPL